ncbi:GntR family transcriptional regulator [Pseudoclavibacter terrae]|uniref:GntR family transcriptional regulator n=1 Tax=Pseudoclavibacter terrae TaxID=1530195 RepID=UPI003137EFF9
MASVADRPSRVVYRPWCGSVSHRGRSVTGRTAANDSLTSPSGGVIRSAEQIYDYFKGLIVSGRLGAGDKLPTVRQSTIDLEVALGTAAKAYKMLEQEGLVVSRGRAGTRVAESGALLPGDVAAQVRATVASAKRHGVARDDVASALRAYWDA